MTTDIYHWKDALDNSLLTSSVMAQYPVPEMLIDDGLLVYRNAYLNPADPGRSKKDYRECLVRYDRDYVIHWFRHKLSPLNTNGVSLCAQILGLDDLDWLRKVANEKGYRLIKLERKGEK